MWFLVSKKTTFTISELQIQFSHYLYGIYFKFQVSLDSRVREIINRNMIAPSQHTFDEAQLQIYTLMHRDSYPRFVNSPTYKNMLRTVGVEPPESSASS